MSSGAKKLRRDLQKQVAKASTVIPNLEHAKTMLPKHAMTKDLIGQIVTSVGTDNDTHSPRTSKRTTNRLFTFHSDLYGMVRVMMGL